MKKYLIAALLLVASVAAGAADDVREFTLDVPADDIQTLRLAANVGEVAIHAAEIDVVEIRARLEFDDDGWSRGGDKMKESLAEAELEHDISGDTLNLRMNYDDSSDDWDLEETWEIRVPARLATDMELNVGSARIEGTSGGVIAEVNVGELDINIAGGDVEADVNVGELIIDSATESPGEFDLEANIGEARLRVDGESAGHSQGWLGNSVSYSGDGDDNVTAHVNVGDVRVDIRR